MTTTAAAAVAQAPAALLALSHHVVDNNLTAPATITLPTPGDPHLTLFLPAYAAADWTDTIQVDDEDLTVSTVPGFERVLLTGRLPSTGITVRLRYARRAMPLRVVS